MQRYKAFVERACYLNPVLCIIRWTLGIICITIGLTGLVLPILPGSVFLALGLSLVGAGWVFRAIATMWKKFFLFLISWFI